MVVTDGSLSGSCELRAGSEGEGWTLLEHSLQDYLTLLKANADLQEEVGKQPCKTSLFQQLGI